MTDEKNIEMSIHGKWMTVPAMEIDGTTIATTGNWLKIAVIHDEEYAENAVQDPELCIRTLKAQSGRRRADIFTFAQKLPDKTPQHGYPMEWDSIAVVRTDSFKNWWESLPQEGRKNVRRAQKRGVEMVVKSFDDALAQGIVDLNNDSPVRQGKAFVHYGKTLEEVKRDQAAFAGRSDYVCAYLEDELIGFLKIVYRGDIASLVQILPKASHHDKRPANALLAKAVELCESKGISYLTYGYFNYGYKQDSPLRQFKVRNGFEEIMIPRFYVPLTAWGQICMRLKLYRGVIGLVPYEIIKVAVNARAKWYKSVLVRKPV